MANPDRPQASRFVNTSIDVKVRLGAMWASVMACYLYGDYFGLFKPGAMSDIVAGRTGAFGTQAGLLAAAVMMAIPSVLICLSLTLSPVVNRVANIVLGLGYTVIIVATLPGAWWFYGLLAAVEAALTLAIAWTAWRWPRVG